jgi:hypothetical protein
MYPYIYSEQLQRRLRFLELYSHEVHNRILSGVPSAEMEQVQFSQSVPGLLRSHSRNCPARTPLRTLKRPSAKRQTLPSFDRDEITWRQYNQPCAKAKGRKRLKVISFRIYHLYFLPLFHHYILKTSSNRVPKSLKESNPFCLLNCFYILTDYLFLN